jgi:hypothetical protein
MSVINVKEGLGGTSRREKEDGDKGEYDQSTL